MEGINPLAAPLRFKALPLGSKGSFGCPFMQVLELLFGAAGMAEAGSLLWVPWHLTFPILRECARKRLHHVFVTIETLSNQRVKLAQNQRP